jgi:hypothetical protein
VNEETPTNSVATASLCKGYIHLRVDNLTDDFHSFSIEPASDDSAHIAYFHRDLLDDRPQTCGVDTSSLMALSQSYAGRQDGRMGRRLQQSHKYIGVAVVNDRERYVQRGDSVHLHSAVLFAAANSLFAKLGTPEAPAAPFGIELQLVSMYTFISRDPWRTDPTAAGSTTNVPPDINGEVLATTLLGAFNNWRRTNVLPLQNLDQVEGHDVAHLLTGYSLQGATIGLAHVNGICELSARAGLSQASRLSDPVIATTITHEIAHNLGALHTDSPPSLEMAAQCKDTATTRFIMSRELSTARAHTNWEACSMEHIRRRFDPSNGRYPGQNQGTFSLCADAPSGATWISETPVCGDGLVQGDEECDCLNGDCSSVDRCCHGNNCTLKTGARCSAQDACCVASTCLVQNNTLTVCREATNACDAEERCDGVSSKCPMDTFRATGTPCKTPRFYRDGTCYWKRCLDAAEECGLRGLEQPLGQQWDDTCSNEVTGFYAYPRTTACSVKCKRPAPSYECDSYEIEQFYEDGTQCQSGKGCYQGVCMPFSRIPVPINPNCSNYRLDPGEIDLDCGGICFGCAADQYCTSDNDCLFSVCNQTVLYSFNGRDSLGKCLGPPSEPVTLWDAFYYVAEWFRNNPFVWGPVIAGILLLVLACTLYHRRRRRNQRVDMETKRESRGRASTVKDVYVSPVFSAEWAATAHYPDFKNFEGDGTEGSLRAFRTPSQRGSFAQRGSFRSVVVSTSATANTTAALRLAQEQIDLPEG